MAEDQTQDYRLTKRGDNVLALKDQRADQDRAYRAIGRYLVEFSRLIATMREMITDQITGNSGARETELMLLCLGEVTAEPIAQTFFAMCRKASELNDYEQKVERVLRDKHVVAEIRRRNAIAHGDWNIPRWGFVSNLTHTATLVRIKASSRDNPFLTEDLTAEKIDQEAARVEALEWMVCEFGCICTNNDGTGRRVHEAFEIVGSSNKPRTQFRADYSTQIRPPEKRLD